MKKRHLLLPVLLAVVVSLNFAWADDFYVVGGGGGVGTKITSLPYAIKNPGFYYLAGNLTGAAGSDGITIDADDVTLDLMGFKLTGPGTDDGIRISYQHNVEIRNGSVVNWKNSIRETATMTITPTRHRVTNVRVQAVEDGIHLGGSGHAVKGCTAANCAKGIYLLGVGTISGCTVRDCSSRGIQGQGLISDNVAVYCGVGIDIGNGTLKSNYVLCNEGQVGIEFPSAAGYNTIATQNCVVGSGDHSTPAVLPADVVLWGNTGLP